jgi:hypothetical protein
VGGASAGGHLPAAGQRFHNETNNLAGMNGKSRCRWPPTCYKSAAAQHSFTRQGRNGKGRRELPNVQASSQVRLLDGLWVQVRGLPGLAMPDALDMLLVQLLVEGGAAGLLEGLVCRADLAAPLRHAVTCLATANRSGSHAIVTACQAVQAWCHNRPWFSAAHGAKICSIVLLHCGSAAKDACVTQPTLHA